MLKIPSWFYATIICGLRSIGSLLDSNVFQILRHYCAICVVVHQACFCRGVVSGSSLFSQLNLQIWFQACKTDIQHCSTICHFLPVVFQQLQCCVPYHCHSAKALYQFVTSFWQLSEGFLCNWPIKVQVAVRGRVDNNELSKANMELDNSASHSCSILIGQLKQKPSESCRKSCHKLIKIFVQVATVGCAALHDRALIVFSNIEFDFHSY